MITRVHAHLDLPTSVRSVGTAFWAAALGWPPDAPEPPHAAAAGPLGVHLHLEVDDVDGETGRLRDLGATVDARAEDGTTAVTSPGGATFFVVSPTVRERVPPVTGQGGVRRRLVQVCLDIPHGQRESETAFWRSVLPSRWTDIGETDFVGRLVPPPGAPLQVLLQELGAEDAGTQVRAHLDLGSDDREATSAELVALGAVRLGTGDGWIPLRDPAGLVFCVTGQSPDNP